MQTNKKRAVAETALQEKEGVVKGFNHSDNTTGAIFKQSILKKGEKTMSTVKSEGKDGTMYSTKCDKCGAISAVYPSTGKMYADLPTKLWGWSKEGSGKMKDYCPKCIEKSKSINNAV